jgi:hypothetical protein
MLRISNTLRRLLLLDPSFNRVAADPGAGNGVQPGGLVMVMRSRKRITVAILRQADVLNDGLETWFLTQIAEP